MKKLVLKTSIVSFFLIALFISVYLSPIMEGFFNVRILRPIFFVLSYGIALLYFIIKHKKVYNTFLIFFVILGVFIFLTSSIVSFNFSGLKPYTGFITALLIVSMDYKLFLKYLKIIFITCFIIAFYEFVTKEFIYEISRVVDGKEIILNEKFFRGWAKIFRAKGIFEGPLSLTQFAIGVSILFKDNIKMVLACLALSIMANGRLGIIITAMLLVIYVIRKYNLVQFILSRKFLLGVIALLVGGAFFVSKMKQSSIDRLLGVFNFNEQANQGRFYYWSEAFYQYFDYNIVNMLFGNLGYYRTLQGNSAENGWLMILLDGGIFSLLFYLIPVLLIAYISIFKKTGHFLFMGVIFLAMLIQTFHSGASANLLYWVIIFVFYMELTEKSKQDYKIEV